MWWAKADRPHETFVFVAWEWDIDKAKTITPIQEGEAETARFADCVEYPTKPDVIDLFKVSVNDRHVDHVSLDEPILLGMLRVPGRIKKGEPDVTAICIDGHHRIARAIRDGVEKIKYRLLSEEDLLACAIRKPPNWKPKRKARRRA